jgi:hypothetical protein
MISQAPFGEMPDVSRADKGQETFFGIGSCLKEGVSLSTSLSATDFSALVSPPVGGRFKKPGVQD